MWKGFAVIVVAVLEWVYGSKQAANIFIWSSLSNSIIAFQVESRNDGGSPHEDGSFIFVAATGLYTIESKGRDLNIVQVWEKWAYFS